MAIRCEICNRGPMQGVTVYRANEKGVKGIWRCADHPCAESFANQHDPECQAIEDALNPPRRERVQ